jgi:hypothetical protein
VRLDDSDQGYHSHPSVPGTGRVEVEREYGQSFRESSFRMFRGPHLLAYPEGGGISDLSDSGAGCVVKGPSPDLAHESE